MKNLSKPQIPPLYCVLSMFCVSTSKLDFLMDVWQGLVWFVQLECFRFIVLFGLTTKQSFVMFLKLHHQSSSFIQSPLQRGEQALKSASLSCKCNSKYGDSLQRYFGYRAVEKIHQGSLFICWIYAWPCSASVFHCMYFSWNLNSIFCNSLQWINFIITTVPEEKKEREEEAWGRQRRRGWVVVGVTDPSKSLWTL